MREESATPPLDILIAGLAERQHGVVGHAQLLALGLSASGIGRRLTSGRLHRIHRGVYAVGHRRIRRKGWWMAATLTTGGVLSHRSASALWGLTDPIEREEVTVPTTAGRRRRKGLTTHRTSSLPSAEVTTQDGIPVTTVPRTFIDLAEVVSRRKLERTLDEAEYLRLFDEGTFRAAIAAHPGRTGAKRLALALDEHTAGTTRTNEGLEERFFLLCRRAGLPDPLVKPKIGPYELDFLWPNARLVVETDDRTHERNSTRKSDHDRDEYLRGRGYEVRRFTWTQVTYEPDEVVNRLKALLYPSITEATASISPSEGATATGIRHRSPAARTSDAPGPSS